MAYGKTNWVAGVTVVNEARMDNLETQHEDILAGTNPYTGTGAGLRDEDDMTSDDATAPATQQSIKAYVDASGQQPTRSAPARAIDTIYQNTTGKPIMVIVSFECQTATNNSGNGFAYLQIGAGTPPATEVSRAGVKNWPSNDNGQFYYSISCLVPDGWYYRLVSSVSANWTVSLLQWEEITW